MAASPGPRSIEILLVEDNPGDVRWVREVLREAGLHHTMHAVTDGEAALDFLNRRGTFETAPRPDLILLDLNLPRLNGLELFEALKRTPQFSTIPVVVLTASELERHDAALHGLPPEAYMLKPLEWDHLVRAVSSYSSLASALHPQARPLTPAPVPRVAERVQRPAPAEFGGSNPEIERLAYITSHDLQEPLRMVSSYLHLLAQRYRGKLDADADEFIGYALEGTSRMQHLLDALLRYSRVGKRHQQLKTIDASEAFDSAVELLKDKIKETGARVTRDSLPFVEADQRQLTEVFQNLIDNALKFRSDARPEIHASAIPEGTWWRISVRDNGIGIEPRHFARIFEVFQRLHTRLERPGAGVGLAIVKKIVEAHGGRIWIESEPGRGATFHFTLRAS